MKTYRIASIPGDGIGPEVITAGVEVLHAVAAREGRFALEVRTFPWGPDHYRAHGVKIVRASCRESVCQYGEILVVAGLYKTHRSVLQIRNTQLIQVHNY